MDSIGGLKPRIWRIDPAGIRPEVISELGSMLRRGCLAIYPTETFYALGAAPVIAEAVERIFAIKGRDLRKALPLIASDRESALSAASEWPDAADRLARRFWPGPLTVIVPAAPNMPPALHAGTGKVAIRISSHPIALLVARAAGGLIVSTSANPAGEEPPYNPAMISAGLLERVDGLLDSGDLAGGLPSTIVDVTVQPALLVRAGAIGRDEIREVVDLE